MTWTIFVRNAELSRIAQLEHYSSFQAILRYLAVGKWTIVGDRRNPAILSLMTPGHGIELVRNGVTLMSGPALEGTRKSGGNDNKVTVTGTDDLVWLERRLAMPEPTKFGPPYSTSEFDVRSGPVSRVICEYVKMNAGAGALVYRQVSGLTVPDPPTDMGLNVTGRARWDNLLDFIRGLAITGNLGFDVVQRGRELPFSYFQPVDRSGSVKFSEDLGNLESYEYSQKAPTVNYVFVGGDGEGTARLVVEKSIPASIERWTRIEEFLDHRSTDSSAELFQKAAERLEESGEVISLKVVPTDGPNQLFGTHYLLGDIVTVILDDGRQISNIVQEVNVSLEPDKSRVIPVVGTFGTYEGIGVFGTLRDVRMRTNNLERR